MSDSKFIKTADQKLALRLLSGRAGHVLLFGGSRSGKTFILVYALIVRALKAPGSRHALLRLYANSIKASIWNDTLPKVLKIAFPKLKVKYYKSDDLVILPNGSELWFGGLEAGERADKILGREFATLYFNECSELSYSAITTALTRLAQKTTLRNRVYYDCNPPGKSHWSYTLFINKTDPVSQLKVTNPNNYASMLMNPSGNTANLPEDYLDQTLAALDYRQRQRFLSGEWLEDLQTGLWKREWIDANRVNELPEQLERIVIGVDPAATSGANADETGIIVAGKARQNYYIIADLSCNQTPYRWSQEVADAYNLYQADRVVAEVNQGGDLVEMALRASNPDISFKAVRASRGKIIRAEPIAALYEQNKVHHLGEFQILEEQLVSYNGSSSSSSPDRLVALVWAITELMNTNQAERFVIC